MVKTGCVFYHTIQDTFTIIISYMGNSFGYNNTLVFGGDIFF